MSGKPGRGWGAAAGLALVTVSFAVVSPGLLIFVPLSLLLLALPPRRPHLQFLGVALAVLAFSGSEGGAFWYAERGWSLILGAWFVIMVVALPGAGFLSRALAALGASVVSAAIFLSLRPGDWSSLDWTISRRINGAAADLATIWANASTDSWAGRFSGGVYQVAEIQILLHPALVSLASLAGLGIAWWAYRRIAVRDHAPLGPLREFRFRDELVWLLIAGILLLILPIGGAAVRTGANLLMFMAALYALRGAAVLLVLFGLQGFGGAVFAGLAFLFLYPVVLATTIMVGLTDTWFDLRARRAAARPGS